MTGTGQKRDPGTRPAPPLSGGRRQVHLVGFMGAGKSTVGRLLARELVWNYLDLDAIVERQEGTSIAELFASRGEAAFRAAEAEALRQVVQKPFTVVALGGGTWLREDSRRLSRAAAVSVWLDAPLEELVGRVGSAPERPLWNDPEAVAALYRQRRPLYGGAEIRVRASGSPEAVAAATLDRLRTL